MLSIYLSMLDTEEQKTRFEQIYTKYHYSILKLAYSILENEDAAYDAVDASLTALARNIDALPDETDEAKEKAYVYKTVKNMAYNEAKKLNKAVSIDYSIEVSQITDNVSPADLLMAKESFDKLTSCIRSMPEEYRDTLTLRFVYNMSCSEIAKSLGENYNTVKSRIRRGAILLRERL